MNKPRPARVYQEGSGGLGVGGKVKTSPDVKRNNPCVIGKVKTSPDVKRPVHAFPLSPFPFSPLFYINVKGGGSGGTGAGGKKKSNNKAYLGLADPKKLPGLLIKNSLRGKKYRGGTITSVSLPKTSTNPNRKKKTTSKTPLKKK